MVKINIDEIERDILSRLDSSPFSNTAAIRKVRRQFSKRIASLPSNSVIELAIKLVSHNSFLFRFIAYELVQYHTTAAASLNSRNIKLLGDGMDSWAAVDTFACYLSGPAWREHQLSDSLIATWARSKDRWWRRAAVVSTVPLNNKARGGFGDAERTLQICRLAIDDRDDMVVKALSWALRELSKREPGIVKRFVSENETNLAPRVVREVRNKLTTGLKNPKSSEKH